MCADLRVLYLVWLASAARGAGVGSKIDEEEEWEKAEDRDDNDGDEPIEPPVPPGLGQLIAPLRAFITLFDVDQDLVAAATRTSQPLKATKEPIERWMQLLPEAERNAFLVRAARGRRLVTSYFGGYVRSVGNRASRLNSSAADLQRDHCRAA
jgi:hypothetical protein